MCPITKARCRGPDCALYDKDAKECAALSIARTLKALAQTMEAAR